MLGLRGKPLSLSAGMFSKDQSDVRRRGRKKKKEVNPRTPSKEEESSHVT